MRFYRKIVVTIAGGLLLGAAVHADGLVVAENPYSTIAARNAFSLEPRVSIPIPAPPDEPLPKLLPTGIMTIFGRVQVLFKVVTLQNSPGSRSGESYCVLAEGEQEDGVKVVKIDSENRTITFNNHGTVQQIPL
jgi:hypothetical protein